jgi:hypothetical protein
VGPGPRARSWSAAFGGCEETYYHVRWHAPHVVVRLLHTRRSTPKEYDSWAQAPVPETGSPWRASGEVFCGALGRQWGNLSLKRDSPKRGIHSHQCPFALVKKDDHQPREGGQRAEPRVHPSRPQLFGGGKRVVLRLHLFGFDGLGAASNAASRRQAKHGCPSTARATVAPCAGPPHPQRPLRRRPPQATLLRRRPRGRTRRCTPWRWRPRAWMVLSSPP